MFGMVMFVAISYWIVCIAWIYGYKLQTLGIRS